jgi:pectate lyase
MRRHTTRLRLAGVIAAATALVLGLLDLTTQSGAAPGLQNTGGVVVGEPIGFGQNTTGGAGGETVTVSSAAEFIEAAGSSEPLVIQVDGTIELSDMEDVTSNKTIIGVGTSGGITGGGLDIDEADNVIIQNLTISGSGDDNINVQYSTNVWIDHNDLSGASDGALDIKRASDNITVSWNRFHDQDKNSLLGHSDDNAAEDQGRLHVTYHHNWFDGTNQRNPRVRFGNPVHVFNNYYNDIGLYGVASTVEGGVLVEANSFENVEDPFHLGQDASAAGTLVAVDNLLVNSGSGETGGSVNPIPYAYSPDAASAVKDIVTAGAGVGQTG